jgi:hypothetical protein
MKSIKFVTLVLISTVLFLFSCKKQDTAVLILTGKIIDAQTLQPIPNLTIVLNFRQGSPGGAFGLYLRTKDNVANCVTNGNGEFILKTNRTYAKDSLDAYSVVSAVNDAYFENGKSLNAKNAESLVNIKLDDIEVYKKIRVNFLVRHSGVNNPNDYVLVDLSCAANPTSNGAFYYGTDSLLQNKYEVIPNIKYNVERRGKKNNISFGPIQDSIIFTNTNNTYNIYY